VRIARKVVHGRRIGDVAGLQLLEPDADGFDVGAQIAHDGRRIEIFDHGPHFADHSFSGRQRLVGNAAVALRFDALTEIFHRRLDGGDRCARREFADRLRHIPDFAPDVFDLSHHDELLVAALAGVLAETVQSLRDRVDRALKFFNVRTRHGFRNAARVIERALTPAKLRDRFEKRAPAGAVAARLGFGRVGAGRIGDVPAARSRLRFARQRRMLFRTPRDVGELLLESAQTFSDVHAAIAARLTGQSRFKLRQRAADRPSVRGRLLAELALDAASGERGDRAPDEIFFDRLFADLIVAGYLGAAGVLCGKISCAAHGFAILFRRRGIRTTLIRSLRLAHVAVRRADPWRMGQKLWESTRICESRDVAGGSPPTAATFRQSR